MEEKTRALSVVHSRRIEQAHKHNERWRRRKQESVAYAYLQSLQTLPRRS